MLKKKLGKIIERRAIFDLRRKLFKILKKYCKTNCKILDLGCGKEGSLDYERINIKIKLAGYDREMQRVKEFCKRYGKIAQDSGVIDLERKGKISGKYDIIIFGGVIQYLSYPKDVLKNIYESLNRNGIFIITTINKENLLRKLEIVSKEPKKEDGEKYIYNIQEMKNILEKTKFKVEDFFGSDFLPMPKKLCSNLIFVCKK